MLITKVRHDWPEKSGFLISRPAGHPQYTFLHFSTAVELEINGCRQLVPPGTCVFYAPGHPQFFHSPGELLHNWFHAESALGELLAQWQIPVNTPVHLTDTAFISECLYKIELEFYADNQHREALIEGYVREFLIRFSRAMQATTLPPTLARAERIMLRKLRQQILSQPEKKWTISQLAELANLSNSRFHTIYKAMFGTSPMHDLIEARVDYAKTLLLSCNKLPLTVIAERLGYNDQYHFIRQFKSVTGETPSAYRKLHK